MKRAVFEGICSHLTLDRSSVDLAIKFYPHIDPQTILAIYMKKSLYMYREAHAKLSAQEFPPDHFYTHFRLRCQQRGGQEEEKVIKEMGEEVGLPPCLMARFILKSFVQIYPFDCNAENGGDIEPYTEDGLDTTTTNNNNNNNTSSNNTTFNNAKNAKIATARITKILRDPESIAPIDPVLSANLLYCLQTDFLTSPLTDQYRQQIGIEKENYMHAKLKEMNVLFHSEAAMRAAGYPKTPDALLAYPVEIDGHIVNWIESKALFSDSPTHQTYMRDQYWPYYNRFGPGLVIYWFGFLEEICSERDREKGILVMDRFPENNQPVIYSCSPCLIALVAIYNMMDEDEGISFSTKIIESSSDLHPVAEILDNLKNDDLALRLGALKRLTTISLALGPDRTTCDLIPFLASLAADEEDEVLLVLAEETPKLLESGIGGEEHRLLEVFEILLQAEETIVRQQAITGTELIVAALNERQVVEFLWPLWQRLSQATFFISKASAASLAASIYPKLPGNLRAEMRRTFGQVVCVDECPIVRRAAAPVLSKLIDYIKVSEGKDVVMNELWPLFLALSSDAQDSVRLLSVEISLSFGDAQVFGAKFIEDSLLPIVLKLAGDRSWRVRYLVGASFTGLLEKVFIGNGNSNNSSIDALTIFTTLLGDSEAEVRTASARQLAGSCAHFPQGDFEKKILPVLRALASDSSVSVRAAVATQLNPLSAIAGAELAASSLFPLYTHFFADESSQVRLNAVSKMDVVCQVMGIEKLSQSILPAIIQLVEDKQWRVREAVIEHLPTLTAHLGEKFFDENLVKICLDLLNDPVHQVRHSAIQNLSALIDKFGIDWCKDRLLAPVMTHLTTNPNYLRRTGLGHVVKVITPLGSDQLFKEICLPALKALATDPVPNVRLSVSRAILDILPLLKTSGQAEIKSTLQLLQQDSDFDVQYFANQALIKI